MTHIRAVIISTARDFFRCWKTLLLTDLLYKLLTLILLGPVVSVLFRILLALSGDAFLSDQDIIWFLLTPVGLTCMLVVAALNQAILMVGMASLLAVLADDSRDSIRPVSAIRIALAKSPLIIRLTVQMIGRLMLTLVPFLAVTGILYVTLLGKHDINFYLHQRPPEFRLAVGLAVGIVFILSLACLRLLLDWFFALPIVFFEQTSAAQSLKTSRRRAAGSRTTILLSLFAWLIVVVHVSALVTTLTIGATRFFVTDESASLVRLTAVIGLSVVVWILVNLAISLLGNLSLAAMYFNLYQLCGGGDSIKRDASSEPVRHYRWRFTRFQFAALLVLGVVVSLAVGFVMIRSVQVEDQVEIIAHRGASKAAPENTLAAVSRAIKDGADWVEIDVQETADGEVVVFHDSDFMKLAGNPLKTWDATVDDLKSIDIGSWFAPQFSDQRVPTLGQVLEECKDKTGVYIELKYYGHDEQLEKRVAEIVDAHEMADQVVIMSLKRDGIQKMRSIRPTWKVGLLMSVSTGNLKNIDVDFLAVNAAFAQSGFIRAAQSSGKEICVWTVNDSISMSNLISRGVNGIITDRPDLARRVLRERAKMTVPQRLLLEFARILGKTPDIVEQ